MTKTSNIQVKEQFVAAVFAGDTNTIMSLVDPAFELHEGSGMPFAGIYRGAEGFLKFLEIFNETFDIQRLEPVRTYESRDPNWIASEFDLSAKVRKTGQLFESTLVETWNFKNAKVASIKAHYFNSVSR